MDAHDYIQAAKGGAIMDRIAADRIELIRIAVTSAFNLKGLPMPSDEDFRFILEAVEKKISAAYPYMTGQELTYITEMGVAGELTRDTRPTASAIFGWMAAYMNSEERKDAMRTYRRTLQWNNRRDTELTPDRVDELNRQAEVRGLKALWQEFKTHGRILEGEHLRGYVAMVMDALEKRRVFNIQPSDWDTARREAIRHQRRIMGTSVYDRALPSAPDTVTKWCMLEMCFTALRNIGGELEVDY